MGLREFITRSPLAVLIAAAVLFYVSARMGIVALCSVGGRAAQSAGALAIAHWLPMAAVAAAMLRDAPDASISIAFAASVASVSLALGTILFAADAPIDARELEAAPHRRAWPMLLPAAVIALLAGFRAQFTLTHAAVLAVQGLVVLLLWFDAPDRADRQDTTEEREDVAPKRSPPVARIAGCGALWIVLALIGAALAYRAADQMVRNVPRLTIGMIAALMIAPALALPLIGTGLMLSRRRRTATAMSTCVGCALLNVCVLLPGTILAAHVMRTIDARGAGALLTTAAWTFAEPVLAFPMSIWRIDTVILILIGAALVPISAGRWLPRKTEGAAMLVIYALYMATSAALAVR